MFKVSLIYIILNQELFHITSLVTVHRCPETEWSMAIKLKMKNRPFSSFPQMGISRYSGAEKTTDLFLGGLSYI